ncbi:Amidase [Macrophomina phaseolina MS6]|uniref:amidase n=1 Tax=Macrophomina phaseolina (strain MS6) TaxID=1126212 RepID=K2S7R1_MACPH|nr:Amidase [Macrophomina phaseolina MS6]
MDWETIAENKRNSITNKIPEEWRIPSLPPPEALPDVSGSYIRQYLTSREVDITETDAVGIIQKTTTGQWTAKEVTLAFCHRAALAHQMVSCLHEIFFDSAVEEAERLDSYFEKYRKPVGPLHGLPVSLKDSIHVKGVETTMGYVGWIGTFEGEKNSEKYKNVEADVATELRTLGAILYVKTSVPPASCSAETGNNIIGYTTNPYNRMLTAGGSSGGEGALIALRGSPAGLGTDIGASVRLPAHFNGLYGLKPSYHRLPLRGLATPMDGQDTCVFVVGPMATTSRSTTLLMKSLLSCEPWLSDPLVLEIPWRDDIYLETLKRASGAGRKLSFGVLRSDGVVNPQPPVVRALDMVESAVRRAGHEVVSFSLPRYPEALQLFFGACFIDGAADVLKQLALSGEPVNPAMPPFFHVDAPKILDATEIMKLNKAIREYRAEFLDHWNRTAESTATGQPLDAVIMPIFPSAAPRRGNVSWMGEP